MESAGFLFWESGGGGAGKKLLGLSAWRCFASLLFKFILQISSALLQSCFCCWKTQRKQILAAFPLIGNTNSLQSKNTKTAITIYSRKE
jgi:hypothetical protein